MQINKNDYRVELIPKQNRSMCDDLIYNKHYAGKYPSVSYNFGLFLIKTNELLGCVSYGTPASPSLRMGIAGKEYISNILELNRLVLLNNTKNEASLLVSRSLRLLQDITDDKIIISFADMAQNHHGGIYQACNFLYVGLSAKRTDWALKSNPNLHGITIADQFRGIKNRAKAAREFYGDDFYLKPRSRKHRYIYLIGDKKFKKQSLKDLKYKQEPYPKPDL